MRKGNSTKSLISGKFQLERENFIVDQNGFISGKKHNLSKISGIKAENVHGGNVNAQMAIKTDIVDSLDDALEQLEELHYAVEKWLGNGKTGGEYLWPFSNPPYFQEVKEQDEDGSETYKMYDLDNYLEYMKMQYGMRKISFSKIRYRYIFDEKAMKKAWRARVEKEKPHLYRRMEEIEASGVEITYQLFRDMVYLNLGAGLCRYAWVLVYLTAASPVYDGSWERGGKCGMDSFDHYASRRNSERGYWNHFTPFMDYDSLENYIARIEKYFEMKLIRNEKELFLPVKLLSREGPGLEGIKKYGIESVELNMIDLNPFYLTGVCREDLFFVHYFVIFIAALDHSGFAESDQLCALINFKRAAAFETEEIYILHNTGEITLKESLNMVLDYMSSYYNSLNNHEAEPFIEFERQKLSDRNKRYAVGIYEQYGKGFVEKGLELAISYSKENGKKAE